MNNNYSFKIAHFWSLCAKILKLGLVMTIFLLSTPFYAQVNYTYGWETEGDMGGWEDPNFFSWYQTDELSCSGNFSLVTNLYFWNPESIINSPNIGTSSGGEFQCSFDYKVINYEDEMGTSEDVFSMVFEWSNSASGPWTAFYTIDDSNHVVSDECVTATANFTPVAGDDVYIRISTELTDMDSDNDILIYIDDLNIVEDVSNIACPIPGGLSVSNTTLSSTQLNWISPGTSFNVEWGESGFTQGTGTLEENVDENSLSIEGLEDGTTYQFYVQNVCDDDELSNWSGPFTFYIGYCISEPTSVDGNGITDLMMADETFTITDDSYHNLLDTVVEVDPTLPIPSSITFDTGYTYDVNIWIDFNKDGVFDNTTELVFQGMSDDDDNTTLDTTFDISDQTGLSGEYRLRIGTADTGQEMPDPCYSDSYGVTIDMIISVPLNCETPLELQADVSLGSAELSWDASGADFEIEWGPQGFTQGTGTIISDVTNPYTLDNLDPGTSYDFYVRQICDAGQSEWSESLTFETLCATAAPVVEDQTFCNAVNTADVEVTLNTGQTAEWYASINGQNALTTISQSGTYYVQAEENNCISERVPVVITIVAASAPSAEPVQYFCDVAVISDLAVSLQSGFEARWYSSATATTPLSPTTVLVNEASYYVALYHLESTCESERAVVQAIITQTPAAIPAQTISLCQEIQFGQISLNTLPNTTIKWYASLSSQQPLSPAAIATAGTYYITQSIGMCESDKSTIEIGVFSNLQKPNAVTQNICGAGSVGDLVATGAVNGAVYQWYTSLTSDAPLDETTTLTSGIYYVSQTLGGCESERRSVSVRVIPQTAPIVNSFALCGGGTVANLYIPSATYITYKWYASASSATELAQNTTLATGTYYVARVEHGCESQRTAVSVTVLDLPSSPTGSLNQSFTVNAIGEATIADLVMDQTNVQWYISYNDARNEINSLAADTPLVSGQIYYATIIGTNGCPSLPTAVNVDVTLGRDDFDTTSLVYYPNPTTDIVTIRYKNSIDKVIVYNLVGQKVLSKTYASDEIQVDISSLSSGNYFFELHSGGQLQLIKVIKK